jgi:hypothetical protein
MSGKIMVTIVVTEPAGASGLHARAGQAGRRRSQSSFAEAKLRQPTAANASYPPGSTASANL